MATINIKLISNPTTGKREIHIDHESEEDATPHEHEVDHAKVVEALVGKGILSKEEAEEGVVVTRVRPGGAANGKVAPEAAPERQANQQPG